MSEETPEFSYIIRRDTMGRTEWPVRISAAPDERAALAKRFGFAALDELRAEFSVEAEGDVLMATGQIYARLAQPCIATGEPVPEEVSEDFNIRFVPEEKAEQDATADTPVEIELDADECDTLSYTDGRIDMGEAIAETLALAINPYPRSPQADNYLRESGVLTEEQAGPFAALAALKS
ncbi:MAG: DUF177 domain-containing protein [Sphingobium sp.]|nr:DUF177 domain-containing protein [Sphingobium sp.]